MRWSGVTRLRIYMSIKEVITEITSFRDARDWAQFHSVRNLIAAISAEAGELQESILWMSDDEIEEILEGDSREKITDEVADVLIYTLLLANDLGEEPLALIRSKLKKNEGKYPVSVSRGRATKYTDLPVDEQ